MHWGSKIEGPICKRYEIELFKGTRKRDCAIAIEQSLSRSSDTLSHTEIYFVNILSYRERNVLSIYLNVETCILSIDGSNDFVN